MQRKEDNSPLAQLKRACWKQRIKVVWTYPLQVGIYQQLIKLIPPEVMTHKMIHSALWYHTHTEDYLKNMRVGQRRLGVGGRKAGRVTKAEAELAKQQLQALQKKTRPRRPVPQKRKVANGAE